MKDLFSDCGIEIETENTLGKCLDGIKPTAFEFSLHGDASCESMGYFLGKYRVGEFPESLRKYISQEKVGFEIVTSIIKTDQADLIKDLSKITKALDKAGESFQSYRAGIHIHTNMGINIKILKKIVELGGHLEQVFFLLGGMGYDFRGIKNDSTYCRPITKYGPPCVETSRGYAQCLSIKDLLEAKSSEDFGERYGDIFNQSGNRYFPVRYTWLNLSNLFSERRGSLEFRIFNKSLNPEKIVAVLEFCKLFSQAAVLESIKPSKESWEQNSIYDVTEKSEIVKTFVQFLEVMGLDLKTKTVDVLLGILDQTPLESIILPKEYIFTHLAHLARGNVSRTHWNNRDIKYQPETIEKNKIRIPKFVDIHTLERDQTRTGRIEASMPEFRLRRG
jgi:hypothetical protein